MEYIFEIGNFGLRWYSFLIAVGLMVGAWVASIEAKDWGERTEHVYNILILALPLALIGARTYHVVHLWSEVYSKDPVRIFFLNEGGIGIYGAIAGSILAVVVYTRWKGLRLSRWLDIGAPALIIGQAIGRWGNFFNQELYGIPSTLPWAIVIDPVHRIAGYQGFSRFHPLFLYESILNAMAFVVLMWVRRRYQGQLQGGDLALLYGLSYGAIRLGLENLRIGNWVVGGGMPAATIISIAAVVGCAGALAYRHVWHPRIGRRKAL